MLKQRNRKEKNFLFATFILLLVVLLIYLPRIQVIIQNEKLYYVVG